MPGTGAQQGLQVAPTGRGAEAGAPQACWSQARVLVSQTGKQRSPIPVPCKSCSRLWAFWLKPE